MDIDNLDFPALSVIECRGLKDDISKQRLQYGVTRNKLHNKVGKPVRDKSRFSNMTGENVFRP